MDRAYSVLQTKAFDEDDDKFYIEGIASTPTPDRMRDIVDPMGAQFKTPMPLLWQHDHKKPVGHMTFAKPEKDGIPFKGELPKVKETGLLKDRIDEAIHSLKYRLVAAVSIGFNPIEFSWMDDGGIHFREWEWLELSLVTIPANSEAVLRAVKSTDQEVRAALGIKDQDRRPTSSSGVTEKHFRKPVLLIPRK